MGSKSFQNTIFAVIFIVIGIAISLFVIDIPDGQESSTVATSGIARNFDVETFEGWVFTLDTLERQLDVLYAPEPNPNSEDEKEVARAEKAQRLDYPSTYLPNLIEEYGISVQKPYSGNFLFQSQKKRLLEFLNNELTRLSEAMTLFRPSSDPIDANDAVVLKALEKYTILLEHLNTSINEMTYQNAHDQSIGEAIQAGMEPEDFYEPIAYGMLATQHLKRNIQAHSGRYFALAKEDTDNTPNFREVANILGVDPYTGEPK